MHHLVNDADSLIYWQGRAKPDIWSWCRGPGVTWRSTTCINSGCQQLEDASCCLNTALMLKLFTAFSDVRKPSHKISLELSFIPMVILSISGFPPFLLYHDDVKESLLDKRTRMGITIFPKPVLIFNGYLQHISIKWSKKYHSLSYTTDFENCAATGMPFILHATVAIY